MASYYSIYKTQNLVSWNYSRCIHMHTNTHTHQGEISFLFRLLKSKFLNMLRSLSSKSTDLTPANENRVSLDDDGRFLNGCGSARKTEAIGGEANDPHLQWAAPAGVLLLHLHLLERHSWTCKVHCTCQKETVEHVKLQVHCTCLGDAVEHIKLQVHCTCRRDADARIKLQVYCTCQRETVEHIK